jgi:hypothetical protein
MSKDSKLGEALKQAALENINEDIHNICINLEQITKDIPIEVKNQLAVLSDDISSLSLGLKAVPQQFDLDFSRKINRILDVAAEIEDHTKKYQKSLVVELETVLSAYVDKINVQLSKKINNSFILKDSSLYFTVFITALLGGLIGASGIAGVIYLMTS